MPTSDVSIASIRKATAADLPGLRELLSQRDQRQWDQTSVNWFLCDLDPAACIAWVAEAAGKLVGLSSAYVREMKVRDRINRVGYWANLYIDPAYRDQMLYPRLPLAMTQGLKPAGLDVLYACVRQRDVAATHLRIGFAHLGRYNVLIKPLRPARLIAKHKRMGSLANAAAAPIDFLYRALLRAKRASTSGVVIHRNALDSIDDLIALLPDSSLQPITQRWDAFRLRFRVQQTREGGTYRSAVVHFEKRAEAAVIYRLATRGNDIRACVIMEALSYTSNDRSLRVALAAAERDAIREHCEVMICLDGSGPSLHETLRSSGYRQSSETYDLLIWPKKMLEQEPALADFTNWRFSFLDHDAF